MYIYTGTIKNQKWMCDEIKDTLNLGNVFHHSIQDPSPSLFLKVVGAR